MRIDTMTGPFARGFVAPERRSTNGVWRRARRYAACLKATTRLPRIEDPNAAETLLEELTRVADDR